MIGPHMDTREKIVDILERNAIDTNRPIVEQIDSMAFTTIVVEFEQEFEIEFPDELLIADSLASIDRIEEIIGNLLEQKKSA